jgi:hypothetical protein
MRGVGADLYFSAGGRPLRRHCPMIASFRNPIIYTGLDLGVSWKQRVRLLLRRGLARPRMYAIASCS